MNYTTYLKGAAAAAVCAVTLVACEGATPPPTSPSAVVGSGGAASNPDGTIVKASTPVGLSPTHNSTGASLTPTLSVQPAAGLFQRVPLPHRFQVSTSENFDPITQSGMGAFDGQGIMRFALPTALVAGTKYFWRVRAEAEDQGGSWSAVRAFTTIGAVAPPPTPTTPTDPNAKRTPNPPAGQSLPLPDMRGELAKFGDARDSCPRGLKYINNPWLDRVIDHFRTFDTRWGYNGKPTKTAADNGGVAVVAAGDEAAYNFSSDPDLGTTRVHLVDMLISHCGTPVIGWRVFTGEEPGRWANAGRLR